MCLVLDCLSPWICEWRAFDGDADDDCSDWWLHEISSSLTKLLTTKTLRLKRTQPYQFLNSFQEDNFKAFYSVRGTQKQPSIIYTSFTDSVLCIRKTAITVIVITKYQASPGNGLTKDHRLNKMLHVTLKYSASRANISTAVKSQKWNLLQQKPW